MDQPGAARWSYRQATAGVRTIRRQSAVRSVTRPAENGFPQSAVRSVTLHAGRPFCCGPAASTEQNFGVVAVCRRTSSWQLDMFLIGLQQHRMKTGVLAARALVCGLANIRTWTTSTSVSTPGHPQGRNLRLHQVSALDACSAVHSKMRDTFMYSNLALQARPNSFTHSEIDFGTFKWSRRGQVDHVIGYDLL